jgi:hypothetical protein
MPAVESAHRIALNGLHRMPGAWGREGGGPFAEKTGGRAVLPCGGCTLKKTEGT